MGTAINLSDGSNGWSCSGNNQGVLTRMLTTNQALKNKNIPLSFQFFIIGQISL